MKKKSTWKEILSNESMENWVETNDVWKLTQYASPFFCIEIEQQNC